MTEDEWLAWNDATVKRIAEGIYEERAFDRLPILADALEDAGCDNAAVLGHCRGRLIQFSGPFFVTVPQSPLGAAPRLALAGTEGRLSAITSFSVARLRRIGRRLSQAEPHQ